MRLTEIRISFPIGREPVVRTSISTEHCEIGPCGEFSIDEETIKLLKSIASNLQLQIERKQFYTV